MMALVAHPSGRRTVATQQCIRVVSQKKTYLPSTALFVDNLTDGGQSGQYRLSYIEGLSRNDVTVGLLNNAAAVCHELS